MRKTLVITVLAVAMALVLAGCGGSAGSSSASASSSSSITSVMNFATQYDEIAATPTDGIENIGSNAFAAKVGDYTMNLSETKTNMIVEIVSNGDFEGMKQIFVDVMTTLDSSLTDQAAAAFDETVASFGDEDSVAELGSYRVIFSAPNETETGHIQVVIEK